MRALVGVTGGHGESVVPLAREFGAFFEILRGEGRRTEWLPGPLARLESMDAILLGNPEITLSDGDLAVLTAWVESGGHLLALGSCGRRVPLPGGILLRGDSIVFESTGKDVFGFREHLWTRGFPDTAFLEAHWFPLDDACTVFAPSPLEKTHELFGEKFRVVPHGENTRPWLRTRPVPADSADPYLVRARVGRGTVTALGSAAVFADARLGETLPFLEWLLPVWLEGLTVGELARRLREPQRHRLLHGYPMAPIMRPIDDTNEYELGELLQQTGKNPDRRLVVGVLPHPFCNPTVKGCGFCTFPNESYAGSRASEVVDHVVQEIENAKLGRRAADALYFGGGTANLTPPEAFRKLCRALNAKIGLADAEVTLEGVPIYFTAKKPSLLEIMKEEIPCRQPRISMGVQSFDAAEIARMGRQAFGSPLEIERVVRTAKDLGFTVSGDLLFNLPGQTLEAMKKDMDRAIDCGFDQVCIYHLVLYEGLGTEWSTQRDLLAQLPGNERACESWLALREHLLARGFVQSSLTNFERADVAASDRRFLYEISGWKPEAYDGIGFGPSALSLLNVSVPGERVHAIKLMNPERSDEYVALVRAKKPAERFFVFNARDYRILYATRKLATLGIDRGAYRSLFDRDIVAELSREIEALEAAKLVTVSESAVALTPRGMFYADSVAGLLAWREVQLIRGVATVERKLAPYMQSRISHDRGIENDARPFHMG